MVARDARTFGEGLFQCRVVAVGRLQRPRKGAKCLRKSFRATRENAIAANGIQFPAAFFFTPPLAHACARARLPAIAPCARAANE